MIATFAIDSVRRGKWGRSRKPTFDWQTQEIANRGNALRIDDLRLLPIHMVVWWFSLAIVPTLSTMPSGQRSSNICEGDRREGPSMPNSMVLVTTNGSANPLIVHSRSRRAPSMGWNWFCSLHWRDRGREIGMNMVRQSTALTIFNTKSNIHLRMLNSSYHIVPNTWSSSYTDRWECRAQKCNYTQSNWRWTSVPIGTPVDVAQLTVSNWGWFVRQCHRWSSTSVICLIGYRSRRASPK